jgi:hypothetical protein
MALVGCISRRLAVIRERELDETHSPKGFRPRVARANITTRSQLNATMAFSLARLIARGLPYVTFDTGLTRLDNR